MKGWNKVTDVHIWHAVQKLLNGADHPFHEPTKYDVIADAEKDTRLPPKAVLGLAAKEALRRQSIPTNFSSEKRLRDKIKAAGFPVVSKGDKLEKIQIPRNFDDLVWTEGRPKRVAHLKRERAAGLAAAKRCDFKSKNENRLLCECCGMDPTKKYGKDIGEACIEVHHKIPLAEMPPEGRRTRLEDLMCVCANCHRVLHREMRNP